MLFDLHRTCQMLELLLFLQILILDIMSCVFTNSIATYFLYEFMHTIPMQP